MPDDRGIFCFRSSTDWGRGAREGAGHMRAGHANRIFLKTPRASLVSLLDKWQSHQFLGKTSATPGKVACPGSQE